MTPAEGRVSLHWDRYRPRHARIEFVDEGRASFAREHLEAAFGTVIEAVLERLRGNAETLVAGNSLAASWNAIHALEPAEQEFSRAAALLGIDPFDVRDDAADAIVAFWDHAEPAIREDVLASVGSESLTRAGEWLDGALRTLAEGGNDAGNDWRGVRGELPAFARLRTLGTRLRVGARRARSVGGGGRPVRLRRPGPAGDRALRDTDTIQSHSGPRGGRDTRVHDSTQRGVGYSLSRCQSPWRLLGAIRAGSGDAQLARDGPAGPIESVRGRVSRSCRVLARAPRRRFCRRRTNRRDQSRVRRFERARSAADSEPRVGSGRSLLTRPARLRPSALQARGLRPPKGGYAPVRRRMIQCGHFAVSA